MSLCYHEFGCRKGGGGVGLVAVRYGWLWVWVCVDLVAVRLVLAPVVADLA